MASQHQYHRLVTRNSIRVIDLSPGLPEDPRLHCNIRHTSLGASQGAFEAVSYTWGSPNERGTILCGDEDAELDVPLNAVTALRHLRKADNSRTLWIDAICIDQNNVAERSAQVRIMGKIFAAAGQVVVYLGESTPGSRLLFQNLAIADACIEQHGHAMNLKEPTADVVLELNELLQRPWFSRIWVIQELVHAVTPLFQCGNDSASYKALHDCLFGYESEYRVNEIYPAPIEIKRFPRQDGCNALQEMFRYLTKTGLCESTDPRDRVLALLSLIDIEPRLEKLINYDMSAETIFSDLALLFLSDERIGLFVLEMIRHPHSRSMPSWVPDWGQLNNFWYGLEFYLDYHEEEGRGSRYVPNVYESYTHTGSPDQRVLVVTGVRRSVIAELGPVMSITSLEVSSALDLDMLSVTDAADATEQALKLRFQTFPQATREVFESLTLYDKGKLITKSKLTVNVLPSGEEVFLLGAENMSQFEQACDNCRIYLTRDGELGVATRHAQIGDTICLADHVVSALVLREAGDGLWRLVCGDPYVLRTRELESREAEEFYII